MALKRAYRTTVAGVTSVVAAETRGRAIARTLYAAIDAGYRVSFPEVKATRAPEHDGWAEQDATGACWNEELLPVTKGP